MEYKLNLGAWNSVFAVPCDIVDKHIKLAGAAQLKVILWILRHAGEAFTTEDISASLSMSAADVRDSMLYWKETGVICENEGSFSPPEKVSQTNNDMPAAENNAGSVTKGAVKNNDNAPNDNSADEKNDTKNAETEEKKASRTLSRPEKPDMVRLTERMNNDASIAYLMQAADEIFGRPTSNNEKETLLLINEYDGLPVEVILMLIQYAARIGKCNARYIEKTAINWSDDEINTLERAEQRIQQLTSGRSAASQVMKLFGLPSHSPTENEIKFADRWLNTWKFSHEMVRLAFEICVDAKHEYIPKYVNTILERWNNSGIRTLEQAEEDKKKNKKKSGSDSAPSYDLEKYKKTNTILEEEF